MAAALGSGVASAGDADRRLAIGGGFETWTLPGRERLGMAHAAVLFEVAPRWWVGPTVFGAATGQRGGFFVGGLSVQRAWHLRPGLALVPGLAIGGGGGGGAAVGDGLMLRPSLALQVPIGRWRAGVGVSRLSFARTDIRSTQWGIVAEWHDSFVAEPLARVGQRTSSASRSGVGLDRFALTGARYSLRSPAPAPRVQLVGVRFDRCTAGRAACWGVEAAAAADSASAGYMEILPHAGAEVTLAGGVRLGARVALGFGGGGAVPTGGGTIGHVDATLALDLAPGWRLGAAIGRVAGTSSSMRGTRAELSLAADLEPARRPGMPGGVGVVRRVEWAGALQHIGAVQRNDGNKGSLQTLGLQFNWWLGDHAYLSAQAHSALGGGAGAYGQGLLGAGAAATLDGGRVQLGVELLAGGSGGGGVQSLAGAMAQGMLWASLRRQRDGAGLRVALGADKPRRGPSSPVVSIGWVVPFGLVAR